jgi:hypothetical protein
LDLSLRVGRGDIWRRKWERVENREGGQGSTKSLKAAVQPGHWLRALIYYYYYYYYYNNKNNNSNNCPPI